MWTVELPCVFWNPCLLLCGLDVSLTPSPCPFSNLAASLFAFLGGVEGLLAQTCAGCWGPPNWALSAPELVFGSCPSDETPSPFTPQCKSLNGARTLDEGRAPLHNVGLRGEEHRCVVTYEPKSGQGG